MSKKILVTGSAGFIGFHLTKELILKGFNVTGIDNLNDYYDVKLKKHRLSLLSKFADLNNIVESYSFHQLDISNKENLEGIFNTDKFDIVINLAAQAGVRYSLDNPAAYVDSNLVGFVNLLECCRHSQIGHFIFASSSSVYGMNSKQPFSTNDNTDYPISLYAATKKSNELIAHSYSHLYNIPCTGLRFFTVYGPLGRPDMAYYKFTKKIDNGEPIDVYNQGKMKRDFTYIDDIVSGLMQVISFPPTTSTNAYSNSQALFNIYNIGNNNPITLDRFIKAIEDSLSKKAIKNFLPMQDGDVPITYADIDNFIIDYGFKPNTSIEKGINEFVQWYKSYI